MIELKNLVTEELNKPGVTKQDILKLLFQNEFGPGHNIENPIEFEDRLQSELSEVEASGDISLFDELGNGYARLNLKRLKYEGIDADFISRLAILSSKRSGDLESFKSKAKDIFELVDLSEEINEWEKMDNPLFSHSDSYKRENDPHYIVINKKYVDMWELLMKLRSFKDQRATYIAIDGRCGSGKSLMADELRYIFDGQIIRMDDFFLPFDLRSKERLEEPGGNVHYERFKDEVKEPLLRGQNPNYGVFSCKTMSINSYDLILNRGYIFIEGSYSLREDLRDLYHLGIFMDVNSQVQLERIEKRNGPEALENFKTRWIPMEERYFDICSTKEKANFSVDTTATII